MTDHKRPKKWATILCPQWDSNHAMTHLCKRDVHGSATSGERNVHNRQNICLSYCSERLSSRSFVRCASFKCLRSVVLMAVVNSANPVNKTATIF